MAAAFTVKDHLEGREPVVAAIYAALKRAAKRLGPFREDPKKTSIHWVRHSAFAGVATRKAAVVLTIKSSKDIKSPRVMKREQTSAGRWHLEVRLESPKDVDAEVLRWLSAAYELSG